MVLAKSEMVDCISRLQSNKLNLNIALSSIVSYCTLRSCLADSKTINIGFSNRRNSTDTDAGSALKQYAASILQDTWSIVSCEDHSGREFSLAEQLGKNDREAENMKRRDDLVDWLLKATGHKDDVLIKDLIEQGVDVNRRGSDGEAPIHLAAEYGTYETVVTLLSHKADPNKLRKGSNPSSFVETPLHLAALRGRENIIRLLLAHGADINARGPKGLTPLTYAVKEGHSNTVQLFIEKGANIDLKSTQGTTALHYAVEFGHLSVVQLLVKMGADIEAFTDYSVTPLMIGCRYQRNDIVAFLLKAGAKIDACQPDSIQAIHLISKYSVSSLEFHPQKEVKIARFKRKTPSVYLLLLDSGANLEAKTRAGKTPLMWAARCGNIPGMKFLLSKGARLDRRNSEGHDILRYAEQWDQEHKPNRGKSAELCLVQWRREHSGRRPLH